MLTKKLNDAYIHTDRLANYLEKREWDAALGLVEILERANSDVEDIVSVAISDVLSWLEGSYLDEAKQWSNDEMYDFSGTHVRITKVEQRKAAMELKRIERTIAKLYEVIDAD